MPSKEIASKQVGIKTKAGTDWPIIDLIYREEYLGKVYWLLVRGLCDGIVEGGFKKYKTKKAALADF